VVVFSLFRLRHGRAKAISPPADLAPRGDVRAAAGLASGQLGPSVTASSRSDLHCAGLPAGCLLAGVDATAGD